MPQLGKALSDGSIGAGHVDAVVGAARQLDDDAKAELAQHAEALVNAAASMTPEQFDREVRGLARDLAGDGGLSRHEQLRRQRNVARWVDKHTGMCKTLLTLDPLDDAKVWTAFNAATAAARAVNQDDDERTWDQLQTDAIVDHITRPTGDNGGGLGAEVSVLIDYTALLHGGEAKVAETSDGQTLPVEVIRRLCCDGTIVPVWLGTDHEVLAVGRQCRLATRAQRRALRAMYRTCCMPGCTVGFEALPDPSRHVLGKPRADQSRQHGPDLRTASPPRPRGRLDPRAAPRTTHHPAPTRRHDLLRRRHHQPHYDNDHRHQGRASTTIRAAPSTGAVPPEAAARPRSRRSPKNSNSPSTRFRSTRRDTAQPAAPIPLPQIGHR